jgi:hypothetical protein
MPTTGRALSVTQTLEMVALVTTTETLALDGLPVTSGDPDIIRTMARVTFPVQAGDVLDIVSRARVTNNVGYTVGVGWQNCWYDASLPADQRIWTSVSGRWSGDNVDVTRHHMPLGDTHDVLVIPADWPAGHWVCVGLRVNAHSTAWRSGDRITVEDLSSLTVRQLRAVAEATP